MASRKHSFEIPCECVSACLRFLWAEDRETKVHKPTFWNLETVRGRWLGHCAPRCHRDSPARWANAAHMACWLSAFLNTIMSNTNSQSPRELGLR